MFTLPGAVQDLGSGGSSRCRQLWEAAHGEREESGHEEEPALGEVCCCPSRTAGDPSVGDRGNLERRGKEGGQVCEAAAVQLCPTP